MPVIKSVKKSVRSASHKRVYNLRSMRAVNTALKNVKKDGDKKTIVVAQKMIDKAVKRGVIKKGTANRKKSQLMRKK